jgi:Neuraminidase (sialidase)
MHNLNENKKKNSIVTAATVMAFLTLVAPLLLLLLPQSQSAQAYVNRDIDDAPVAASGENVYVGWANNQSEIMFRASNDNGATFSDKINLSNSPEFSSLHPYVSASEDNVYVSFHDNRTGNVDTYLTVSTDEGQTFSNATRINGTGTMPQPTKLITTIPGLDPLLDSEENTRVASFDNNVYVVSWDRKSGNWEVFIARSTDNGQTFEETINLSNTSDTRSDQAEIVAEGENVYVSWWEKSENGTREPVMRVSNDAGETFGPMLRLAANGTIGVTEEEEAAAAAEGEGEEEAAAANGGGE